MIISTQAQLIIDARRHGYITGNTKADRTLLCPQCSVEQAILFHKKDAKDAAVGILACPCGHRSITSKTKDKPAVPPSPTTGQCMAITKKGYRCTRKAVKNGYCAIKSHSECGLNTGV